jgi:hypothetical protein
MKKYRIFNCLDCGKEINTAKSIRCKSCSKKGSLNPMFGREPHNYRGGTITMSGSRNILYREICINGRRIKEHRHIVERELGRKLKESEVVHHIDGNGLNNDISNLSIMSIKDHLLLHRS